MKQRKEDRVLRVKEKTRELAEGRKVESANKESSRWDNEYLNLLETVGHHSNEHVYEDYDGHDVVGHEETLAHRLYKHVLFLKVCALGGTDTEQRPEERRKGHVQPRTIKKEK